MLYIKIEKIEQIRLLLIFNRNYIYIFFGFILKTNVLSFYWGQVSEQLESGI